MVDGSLARTTGDGPMPVVRVGRGSPAVLLHGLGSDAQAMVRDIGQIDGLELFFPDQRGHGHNPSAAGPNLTLDDLVADFADLLDYLRLDRPIIGGGSMGAAVTLRFALTAASSVQALVLFAPAVTHLPPAAGPFFATIADRIDEFGLDAVVDELVRDMVSAGTSREHALAGISPWLRQSPKSLTNLMRAAGGWTAFADATCLGDLDMPVAVVGIQDDPIHPLEVARQLHATLPRCDLQVVRLAEARVPGAIGAAVRSGLHNLGVR